MCAEGWQESFFTPGHSLWVWGRLVFGRATGHAPGAGDNWGLTPGPPFVLELRELAAIPTLRTPSIVRYPVMIYKNP